MSGDLRIKCEMMNGDLRRIRIYTNGDLRYNLDFFFLQLQQLTGVRLYEKESVIIFDEVQLLPKARQAIKYLVADGRYKYIETGSFLSIRKNTKDILIPSEEHKISMYPMDFEEFLWAVGDEITADTIKLLLKSKKSAGNAMHRNLMRMFRLYMLIGGMPQAVEAYLEHNNPKGYILNTGCQLPIGTPKRNVEAFIYAARKYGRGAQLGKLPRGILED